MVIRPAIRPRPYMSSVLDSRRGPCFEMGTIVQLPACARQVASRAGVQAKKSAAPAFAGAAAGGRLEVRLDPCARRPTRSSCARLNSRRRQLSAPWWDATSEVGRGLAKTWEIPVIQGVERSADLPAGQGIR